MKQSFTMAEHFIEQIGASNWEKPKIVSLVEHYIEQIWAFNWEKPNPVSLFQSLSIPFWDPAPSISK